MGDGVCNLLFYVLGFKNNFLFEEQLCELVEAATPSVELVCCAFRLVTNSVHAELLLDFLGSFNTTHVLLATTAHEEELGLLSKTF